jgi:hypothetical protein
LVRYVHDLRSCGAGRRALGQRSPGLEPAGSVAADADLSIYQRIIDDLMKKA